MLPWAKVPLMGFVPWLLMMVKVLPTAGKKPVMGVMTSVAPVPELLLRLTEPLALTTS